MHLRIPKCACGNPAISPIIEILVDNNVFLLYAEKNRKHPRKSYKKGGDNGSPMARFCSECKEKYKKGEKV